MSHSGGEHYYHNKKKKKNKSSRDNETTGHQTAYTGGAPSNLKDFAPADPDMINFTRPATRPTADFNKGTAARAGKKRKHPYNKKEFGE